jgi:CelD/BcsL family acetyltransferase involved in cellulose biosynthesis
LQAVFTLEEALAQEAQWDDLIARAAQPNPYFTPGYIRALMHIPSLVQCAKVVVVRDVYSEAWQALWIIKEHAAWFGVQRIGSVLPSPYSPLGNPLIDITDPTVAARLLEAVAQHSKSTWFAMPQGALNHPSGEALCAAAAAKGWLMASFDPFQRAVLHRFQDYTTYTDCVRADRRKTLKRHKAHLESLGTLVFDVIFSYDRAFKHALEAFLTLEHAGWKGRAGTSLLSSTETAAFARTLAGGAKGLLNPRIERLVLNGTPIATSLALDLKGRCFLLKTAFDESLRTYAPGVLLESEIIRWFHEKSDLQTLDTASVSSPMLSQLFLHSDSMADIVIRLRPDLTDESAWGLLALERGRRSGKEWVKDALKSLLKTRR